MYVHVSQVLVKYTSKVLASENRKKIERKKSYFSLIILKYTIFLLQKGLS